MKRTVSQGARDVAAELRREGRVATVRLPNPYAVLSLSLGEQCQGTIRQAFLRAVRAYPPHSHPTEFYCIVEAYDMLRDTSRRAALERHLSEVRETGKHRRLDGLTLESAVAFLRARDGPVCALDEDGLCHPAVHRPAKTDGSGIAAAGSVQETDDGASASRVLPELDLAAAVSVAAATPLESSDDEATGMMRTDSVASAMSVG